MIESIELKAVKRSPMFGYAAELPFVKAHPRLEFRPGLNILFGPNGSGKSTILKVLAHTLCAYQGGVSTITLDAISDTVDMLSGLRLPRAGTSAKTRVKGPVDKLAVPVAHDGQPAVFCDPRRPVGLSGGAFDDAFFMQGVLEVMTNSRRSHGQSAATRASTALQMLAGQVPFPAEISYHVRKSHINDMWQAALAVLEARLTPSIAKGQPSVLLDEPEANYSLAWQARLWRLLADATVAQNFQVVVATHSPFALGIGHAHYIDLEPGFRQEALELLTQRFSSGSAN